jgi:hypothetical protein
MVDSSLQYYCGCDANPNDYFVLNPDPIIQNVRIWTLS